MPCFPVEYPEQSEIEKEIINLLYIEDELNGQIITYSYSHDRIDRYHLNREELSILTSTVCKVIRQKEDISIFSRRVQIWWIEHQFNDFKRINHLLNNSSNKLVARASLSSYEIELHQADTFVKKILKERISYLSRVTDEIRIEANINLNSYRAQCEFLDTMFLLCSIENIRRNQPTDDQKGIAELGVADIIGSSISKNEKSNLIVNDFRRLLKLYNSLIDKPGLVNSNDRLKITMKNNKLTKIVLEDVLILMKFCQYLQ